MENKFNIRECRFGRGLFAAGEIPTGELILHFRGPRITRAEAIAKGELSGNPLQVGNDAYIDIEPPGVLANHSCDPNSGIINDTELIAIRDIEPGEEICYDYSSTMHKVRWRMRCECGSDICRGIVGEFRDLPEHIRRRYLELGVVQRFIVRDSFLSHNLEEMNLDFRGMNRQ